jgi:hypothetical protein
MAERRQLVEGLKGAPEVHRAVEEQFVFGNKPNGPQSPPAQARAEPAPPRPAQAVSRSPFTTRVRTDLAQALKRASLERQLQGVEPSTVQDILEEALEPWLRTHGYLG